jgi:enterochelin esterase-like enzyme
MLASRLFATITVLGMTWAASATASGQAQRRQPTPNDTLKSTEVAPDKTVTFRIYAPKADEVSVGGDFGRGGKMTKDEKGIWSLTVGPLTPDFYSYTFTVDSVRTVDPKNPMIKQGVSSLESMFLVPGDEAEFEATKDVPHGEVRSVWYRSSTLGEPRRMHVYTPPGYQEGDARYPVFYLLHGGGDEDSGWSTIGRAGFILDNLIAAGKAVPMIVAMPNGSLPPAKDMPARPAAGEAPSAEFRAAMEKMQGRFTDELLKDVVPAIEKTFRVKTGADNRALAGLSMGGGQTLRVLVSHADQFAYVGIWSAGIFGGNAAQWEQQNEQFLAAKDKSSGVIKRLEIVVGDQDFAQAGSKALSEIFKKRGVEHDLRITGGGHTWINWRHYLNDLAPKLFR